MAPHQFQHCGEILGCASVQLQDGLSAPGLPAPSGPEPCSACGSVGRSFALIRASSNGVQSLRLCRPARFELGSEPRAWLATFRDVWLAFFNAARVSPAWKSAVIGEKFR